PQLRKLGYWCRGANPVEAGPVPSSALRWICRGFGNASVRRAYAEWRDERFGKHEQPLAENSVDLVQLGRFTPGTPKNAVDVRLDAHNQNSPQPVEAPSYYLDRLTRPP
ncbi:hypothetical protein, partial [Nocardia cyriacigeorgica]|uniref:hypothetical protein n=1 Tax=Nocardia cyriacigeorgica TaxID=135487 RepID=UPI001B85C444